MDDKKEYIKIDSESEEIRRRELQKLAALLDKNDGKLWPPWVVDEASKHDR